MLLMTALAALRGMTAEVLDCIKSGRQVCWLVDPIEGEKA